MAERELGAAAAGVEDDERAAAEPEPGHCGEVGEAGLLLAGDDLDPDAAAGLDGVDELRAVRRDAQPGGADRRDRVGAGAASPRSAMRRDRLHRPPHRLRLEACRPRRGPRPRRVTSARSTTVLHVPSARRSPTWNLTEFVPTSITANRFAPKPTSVFRPRAMQTFVAGGEAERAHGGDHEGGILRLDRDRARRAPVRPHLAELGHAAADRVARAPLVHVDGQQSLVRAHDLVEELVEGVGGAVERARGDPQRGEHDGDVGGGQRKGALQHRHPLLEPVVVDRLADA